LGDAMNSIILCLGIQGVMLTYLGDLIVSSTDSVVGTYTRGSVVGTDVRSGKQEQRTQTSVVIL
jgi:hypothetical protein